MVRWIARFSSVAAGDRRAGVGVPGGASCGSALVEQAPQTVEVAPGAVDPGLGPFQVALGRAVGQHEQARGVGAVGRR